MTSFITCRMFRSVSLACLFAVASLANAETSVVVNPENASTLSVKDIEKIFLGKKKSFPGGGTAVPHNLPEKSPARDGFNESVLRKNTGQVKSYWAKLLFTGKGVPPKEVASDSEMLSAIAGDKGGIGYVDSSKVDATVKVIHTF